MNGRVAGRSVATIVALAVLALTLHGADWRHIATLCTRVGATVTLVVMPQGVGLALQAIGLCALFETMNVPMSRRAAGHVLVASEAARLALPAGAAAADGLLTWYASSRLSAPLDVTIGAVVTRKWLLVATHAAHVGLTLLALLVARPTFADGPIDEVLLRLLLGATFLTLGSAAASAAWLLRSPALGARLASWLRLLPSARIRAWVLARRALWHRTGASMARVWTAEGARGLFFPALMHQALWLLEGFETWLVARLIGADITFATALVVETGANLVRAAAFAIPGGLGAQDASYVALLALFGVPDAATTGGAFVVLKRLKELVWIAIGYATVGWGAMSRRATRPRPAEEEPPP